MENNNENYQEDELQIDGQEEFDAEDKETSEIEEYDLTSTPNDFNILTIGSFIDSGAVTIPGFQRNYVWDLKKASKLIESLILGLPVPQLFLYEEGKNKFSVIDGQQRLMTIYYFIKGRFPKADKRPEIRKIFTEHGEIPAEVFHDDDFFRKFKLTLPSDTKGEYGKFHGLSYETLADYKSQFDLRPIRNVIVKQNVPKDDDSSVYEIFNRLNSGGVNLKPQEIRSSLYHSEFYTMIHRVNSNERWRTFLKKPNLDLHMRDFELLLRAYAFLHDRDNYAPSLAKFLNTFSKKAKSFSSEKTSFSESVFNAFMNSCQGLPTDIFINVRTKRFNAFLFEAVFYAFCLNPFNGNQLPSGTIEADKIRELEDDPDFQEATQVGTTSTTNVDKRLNAATRIIS